MRENGEEKKKREVIYNGLSTSETTCTHLAGEKGARRKFGKEQPLGQSDIVVQWKGKCSHKSRPCSRKRSINWEAFSTCCDVSVEVTLLSAGGRGHSHRMMESEGGLAGRGLKAHLVPTPAMGRDGAHPNQVAQGLIQPGPERLQGWGILSGQHRAPGAGAALQCWN